MLSVRDHDHVHARLSISCCCRNLIPNSKQQYVDKKIKALPNNARQEKNMPTKKNNDRNSQLLELDTRYIDRLTADSCLPSGAVTLLGIGDAGKCLAFSIAGIRSLD